MPCGVDVRAEQAVEQDARRGGERQRDHEHEPPCRPLALAVATPQLIKRFTAHGASGAYLRVLETGDVGAGDRVEVVSRPDHGVTLGDAMAGAGVDPGVVASATQWLERLAGFVELHIDQTRDLAALAAPVGAVLSLASRMRLALTFAGSADHAGTTRREERRDALAAAARLIVAADELAGQDRDFLVTATRMLVEPNAFTTGASAVTRRAAPGGRGDGL